MRTDEEIVEQTNKLALLLVNQAGYNVPEGHKFYESEDPRSISAWKRACEIQGLLTATNPEDALSNIDGDQEDAPALITYGVRFWATFRSCAEMEIEAENLEDLEAKVRAVDWSGLQFASQLEDLTKDGDESASLFGPMDGVDDSDPWGTNLTEVDLRADGEPMSWEAVRIVKDLAALHGEGWESTDIVRFISRAQRACTKITGGMEG